MNIFNKKSHTSRNKIRILLKKIEKWKNISLEVIKYNKDKFQIILREIKPYSKRKYPRRIIISNSYKLKTYSISTYEIHKNKNDEEKYLEIYNTKVEGNYDIKTIANDLKEIIHGKDEIKIRPNFPF